MSTLKVTTIQNTSGVEVYTCKAWVNFNGTGTVAIRAAGNVSSITDNGVGDYTVNFTNAMADANYTPVCSGSPALAKFGTVSPNNTAAQTTTAVRMRGLGLDSTPGTFSIQDFEYLHVAIFR